MISYFRAISKKKLQQGITLSDDILMYVEWTYSPTSEARTYSYTSSCSLTYCHPLQLAVVEWTILGSSLKILWPTSASSSRVFQLWVDISALFRRIRPDERSGGTFCTSRLAECGLGSRRGESALLHIYVQYFAWGWLSDTQYVNAWEAGVPLYVCT